MRNFNKNTWLIILLITLNLFSLGALWFSKGQSAPRMDKREHEKRVERYLQKELDLSDEQFEAMHKFRAAHFQEKKTLIKEIRKFKRAFLESIDQNTIDSIQIDRYVQKIGLLEEKKERQFVEHLKQLKTVCTPEQQQKLSKVFLKGMHSPHGDRSPH